MSKWRFFLSLVLFTITSIYFTTRSEPGSLYRKSLKNQNFSREGPPNLHSERETIAEAGNTYLGPVGPTPGNPQLIQIQILVMDDPNPSGLQVTRVEFNQKNIPLKTRDIYGNRGGASFQLPPGSYRLKWSVNRDKIVWPREIEHEEIVHVSPRDSWVQIEIVGNQANIS